MSGRLSSFLALGFVFFCLPSSAQDKTLLVAAASDLSAVGPELRAAFCKVPTTCPVRFVNGSSAALAQQIDHGAQFDLFLSANEGFVDRLASNGKIDHGSVKAYAIGRLGVLWRDGKKHPLRELSTPAARYLALPNPKLAPYGAAAQQALEYAGLWGMVQSKVVYGENVRQALQLLESGNADAVITSDSLLQGKDAELIPADWHKPIVQKAGIVAASQNRGGAQRFLEFLLGPAGEGILAKYGFGRP
ncbi:MAG: molybdate ABC transporter substrate-binding protein [Bryobacteraceae bacterium]